MIRRRAAAVTTKLGDLRFRATGIAAYLKNGGTLEKAAAMANHGSTSATQLYDRRRDELTLDGRADRNSISVSSRSGSSERRTPDPAGI